MNVFNFKYFCGQIIDSIRQSIDTFFRVDKNIEIDFIIVPFSYLFLHTRT